MNPANRKQAQRPNPVAAGRTPPGSPTTEGAPSARLAPGTLCYLTGSGGENADLIGRVVQIVRGPREEFGEGPGPYYEITAPWITAHFLAARFRRLGVEIIIVHRRALVPITPDGQLEAESATTNTPAVTARQAA